MLLQSVSTLLAVLTLAGGQSLVVDPHGGSESADAVIVAEPTSVTVMGLDDFQTGDTVPVDELIDLAQAAGQDIEPELDVTAAESSVRATALRAAPPATAARASLPIKAAADPAYSIYSQWWDNRNIKVAVRNGTNAWGWQHLQKHNVSLSMLKKTTQFPRNRDASNTGITYVTPANLYTCWLTWCRVDKTIDVKVVMNNTRLNDGAPRGIITAYCIGSTVCPDWVRQVAG